MIDPTPGHRIERDTMGEVAVPASARWGAQTQRAVDNFPVSGRAVDSRLVHAVALIKAHAAEVNASIADVVAVDAELGERIAHAAREVAAGVWDDEFPIDAFQTGSATSTNMNVNEVVASLASERGGSAVHPNDHVNASQSSNDVIPSGVRLAAAMAVVGELLPAMRSLRDTLAVRAEDFATVVKAGRTHWMDATPVTLGQEMAGYAAQVDESLERLEGCLPRLCRLPLGGTATGTGLNCPEGFATAVIEALGHETGLPLVAAPDRFATQGAADAVVELSSHLRTVACTLSKVAGDLRAMASGPRTGLAEIRLPDLQPGSSIMPGKVNPVIPEVVLQVAAQVVGNDAAVAFAGAQGNFELLTYQPLLARNVLESVTLLRSACTLLADRCVAGIEADVPRCRAYAEATPAVATALNPLVGYERAAGIVKESMATGRSVRDLIVEAGLVDPDRVDAVLDVLALTRPGLH